MHAQGATKCYGRSCDTFVYDLPRPIWVHVGRVDCERGINRFLRLPLPGSKVVIGDGPDRDRLQRDFPACRFLGYKFGGELAAYVAGADVFVYPDQIDSFGLVVLRAMAGRLPIAAISKPQNGRECRLPNGCYLDDDLELACERALAQS